MTTQTPTTSGLLFRQESKMWKDLEQAIAETFSHKTIDLTERANQLDMSLPFTEDLDLVEREKLDGDVR